MGLESSIADWEANVAAVATLELYTEARHAESRDAEHAILSVIRGGGDHIIPSLETCANRMCVHYRRCSSC